MVVTTCRTNEEDFCRMLLARRGRQPKLRMMVVPKGMLKLIIMLMMLLVAMLDGDRNENGGRNEIGYLETLISQTSTNSKHWSLIVICHLKEVATYQDGDVKEPCILHMNSLRKFHTLPDLKVFMRSYLKEEWIQENEKKPQSCRN